MMKQSLTTCMICEIEEREGEGRGVNCYWAQQSGALQGKKVPTNCSNSELWQQVIRLSLIVIMGSFSYNPVISMVYLKNLKSLQIINLEY